MSRAFLLLLIFSLGFAQLIDYDYSHSTGHLYQIGQADLEYYLAENVVYHLDTQLSVPSSNWLSGSGSYSDVHAGDYICTGTANYEINVNAKVPMAAASGYIPSYSEGLTTGPGDWQNCAPHPSCPTLGDVLVRWSESAYGTYMDETLLDGKNLGAPYGYRSISYRESGTGAVYDGEVAESATVMRGTSSFSGGYSSPSAIYSFSPLSGTAPSHSGSLTLSSGGDYTFVQRIDVTGAVIGAYNSHVGREDYRAYKDLCTNPPSCSSQNQEYSLSNVHESATIHVLDASNVGIIAPTIQSVSLQGHTMSNGHYLLEPGEDIPLTITVRIPPKTSAYEHYLLFELENAEAIGPFSFTASRGLHQCDSIFPTSRLRNGGWGASNVAYTVPVTGTLHVPDTLPQGGGNFRFRVEWQSCSNQPDCGAAGESAWTSTYDIPYIPPDNGILPDLVCSIEPVSIIGAPAGATELEPGQGVEKWRVTVTNIGSGNLTLSTNPAIQLGQRLCLGGLFNAGVADLSGSDWVYPFGYWFLILPSAPSLNAGGSMSKIINGSAYCTEEGSIGAVAFVNAGPVINSGCGVYAIEEAPGGTNDCIWEIPCVPPNNITEDENCTISPSSYDNAETGDQFDFGLSCQDENGQSQDCEGSVGWEISPGGSITGGQTSATATVENNESALEIAATVDNPSGNDAVCYARIFMKGNGTDGDGGENACHIEPTPQSGYPGSTHLFNLWCSGYEIVDGECPSNPDWSFVDGGEQFVVGGAFTEKDWSHAIVDLNPFAVNTTIVVQAEVDFDGGAKTCRGEIVVPPIPCKEYV